MTSRLKIDSKLNKQFFSIGEASKLVNVDQHVLRFWESKFLQINPLRKAGNRRYYRKEDIEFLIKVKELLYDQGLSIKGVQKLFKKKAKTVIEEEPEFSLSSEDYPALADNIVLNKSVVIKMISELKSIKSTIKEVLVK
ncbi:MerR family transcriptional regulator [Rickettsiales bacterium LUAb2]